MDDNRVAALDGDWTEFSPAERVAFALARRLTYEPHTVGAADIDALRRHYTEVQVLEIIFTVAGNNATNRWTEALGIPQEKDGVALLKAVGKPEGREARSFRSPTSDQYKDRASLVAPLSKDAAPGKCKPAMIAPRPALESRAEVEAALGACRKRTLRLSLVQEDKARALLPKDWPAGPPPSWVRLLANFPKAGLARARGLRLAEEKGTLDARLKAQVAWIAARHDRAWYAVGCSKRRLNAMGLSDDVVYALDGSWGGYTPAERAAFALARKLTVAPASIVDVDISDLRKHFADRQVAELVYHVCNAAFFDRLTEAAGLALEP